MADDLPALAQAYLGPNRMTVAKHGLFLYAAEDTVIGRALEVYGEFNEAENGLLVRFIEPGQVFVDIGANIGTVTVPLARRVGPNGAVVAFEPQRRVFTLLCANLALNGLVQVRPICAALGAAPGSARIATPKPGRPGNLGQTALNTAEGSERVAVATLDSYNLTSCALIKIDVEGMEFAVLGGATATIERCRPLIYFEAHPGPNTQSCIEFLMARNYALYWHGSPFVRKPNFRNVEENIFLKPGQPPDYVLGDINAFAIPRELNRVPRLSPILRPDADWKEDMKTLPEFLP